MGIFDKIKKAAADKINENETVISVKETVNKITDNNMVNLVKSTLSKDEPFFETNKVYVEEENINSIMERYIAFDTETTGLDYNNDKIIEFGAVLFENGVPISSINRLVKSCKHIPAEATAVNHITDKMLRLQGVSESTAYKELTDFFGDAMKGKTVICAHNADFDMSFLEIVLKGYGYEGRINYVDTLALSRHLIRSVVDYKQETIARAFFIENNNAHRAESDALTCGLIFKELLKIKNDKINIAIEKEQKRLERCVPDNEELKVCAFIQNFYKSNDIDISKLAFYKNSSGLVDVLYEKDEILQFKHGKKKKYFVVNQKFVLKKFEIELCSEKEGLQNARVIYKSILELEKLSNFFMHAFKKRNKSDEYKICMFNSSISEDNFVKSLTVLSDVKVKELLCEIN